LLTWGDHIDLILTEFIETFQGHVNVDFWNHILDICLPNGMSGSTTTIRGWMVYLLCENEELEIDSIPNLSYAVPVKYTDVHDQVTRLKIVGRFSRLDVNPSTGLIQCQRSYAVIDLTCSQQALIQLDRLRQERNELQQRIDQQCLQLVPIETDLRGCCKLVNFGFVTRKQAEEHNCVDLFELVEAMTNVVRDLREQITAKSRDMCNLPLEVDDVDSS
jgi:hypothetical protein